MTKALSPPPQEEKYLEHIKHLQELYEVIGSFIRSGYDGPFIGEEIRPIIETYNRAYLSRKELNNV